MHEVDGRDIPGQMQPKVQGGVKKNSSGKATYELADLVRLLDIYVL
jgi:hypothetical protein